MSVRRVSLVVTAALASIAAIVAVTATAFAADRRSQCQTFPAALGGGTRTVCGPILQRYLAEGGPGGALGLPLDEQAPNTSPSWQRYGDQVTVFARGAIYLDTPTGSTAVPGIWTSYTP